MDLDSYNWEVILTWDEKVNKYKQPVYSFKVRDKEIKIATHTESLSHSQIPKVALPKYEAWGDILRWCLQENVPGELHLLQDCILSREKERIRLVCLPEKAVQKELTNVSTVLSAGMPAKRLSTAFDSVTLYGNDPHVRPDIYGKIGNAGVSICCLDDAKKLYSGFDLVHAMTSVSMTINGPAPMLLGFFMNAAIDQQCEHYIKTHKLEKEVEAKIKAIYDKLGVERPKYQGELPAGNNGLGLMLLGVTGDQVLPADVYNEIKAKTLWLRFVG